MSPEQQRIAIAEACGYAYEPEFPNSKWLVLRRPDGTYVYTKFDQKVRGLDKLKLTGELPDYLADLNACAAMEATLNRRDKKTFLRHLLDIVLTAGRTHPEFGRFYSVRNAEEDMVSATAPQRCEAFLRVKGIIQ